MKGIPHRLEVLESYLVGKYRLLHDLLGLILQSLVEEAFLLYLLYLLSFLIHRVCSQVLF